MGDEEPKDPSSIGYWVGIAIDAKARGDKVTAASANDAATALSQAQNEPAESEVSANVERLDQLVAEGGDNARIAKEWGRDSDHVLSKARMVALAHPDIVQDAKLIPDDETADYIERIADAGDGLGLQTINEQINEIQTKFPVGTAGNTSPLIQRRLRRLFAMQYGEGPIVGRAQRVL